MMIKKFYTTKELRLLLEKLSDNAKIYITKIEDKNYGG